MRDFVLYMGRIGGQNSGLGQCTFSKRGHPVFVLSQLLGYSPQLETMLGTRNKGGLLCRVWGTQREGIWMNFTQNGGKIITEKIVKDNHGMPLTPQIGSGRMMLHLGGSCEIFASDAHLEPFQNGTR